MGLRAAREMTVRLRFSFPFLRRSVFASATGFDGNIDDTRLISHGGHVRNVSRILSDVMRSFDFTASRMISGLGSVLCFDARFV